jgi:hypothetical protein
MGALILRLWYAHGTLTVRSDTLTVRKRVICLHLNAYDMNIPRLERDC